MVAVIVAAVAIFAYQSAQVPGKLTLQLKWVTQAQFAGYYVAKDKGFYDEVGLDVTIKAGGPDINPSQVIAGGGADVVLDWMPSALATREKGVPLVNIAQVFQKSGMELTCRKDTRHPSAGGLQGQDPRRLVRRQRVSVPVLDEQARPRRPRAAPTASTVLKQGFNVDPLLQKQADCISTMTYNEYWQVIDAGLQPDRTWSSSSTRTRASPRSRTASIRSRRTSRTRRWSDKLARFVKASMKGWDWAVANPDEAAMIVLKNDETGAQTEKHQKRMMGEIAKLVGKPEGHRLSRRGRLSPDGEDPDGRRLRSRDQQGAEGAWTHDVFDKAAAMQ